MPSQPTEININPNTPAAPFGFKNAIEQADASSPVRNMSLYLPAGDASAAGSVRMVGDFGGTGLQPIVAGIWGVPFDGTLPTQRQVPYFNGDNVDPNGLGGVIGWANILGGLDKRTTTTETINDSSRGMAVTLNNSSAIAVTLDSANVKTYFACLVAATGTGDATLTPSGGALINGASNATVTNGTSGWLFWDGTNFYLFKGGGGGGTFGLDLLTVTSSTQKVVGFNGSPLDTTGVPAEGNVWQWSASDGKYQLVTDRPSWPMCTSPGIPQSGQLMFMFPVPAAISFPANFSTPNSRGFTLVNPTATFTFTIYKYSSGVTTTVGTITVSTSGVWTFATTGGVGFTVNAGDVLYGLAQGTVDATFSQFGFVLVGTRTSSVAAGTPIPIFTFRGAYNNSTTYTPFDVITDSGNTYLNILSCTGVSPTVTTNWAVLATAGAAGGATAADIQNQIWVYCVDTGSANALVVAPSVALTSYVAGLGLKVKVAANNTGATTINVSSLGTKSIKNQDGSALSTGSLKAGGVYSLSYDGTNFQLVGGGGGDVTAKYIIGASDSLLANALVWPGLYNSVYAPPTSPSSDDDEFDAGSLTGWTWLNQGSATATLANSKLHLQAPGSQTTFNWRIIRKTVPGSGTWTYTTGPVTLGNITWKVAAFCGLGLYESGTGKFVVIGPLINSALTNTIRVDKWTNTTTFSASSVDLSIWAQPVWLRVTYDGTNLIYYFSYDGDNWLTGFSAAKTNFFTTAPTDVILGVSCGSTSTVDSPIMSTDYIRRT